MVIDWQHVGETILTVTVPIVILMWKNRATAKRDTEKKHEENTQALLQIKTTLSYHEPHTHVERAGPLTAEGIRYPRTYGPRP